MKKRTRAMLMLPAVWMALLLMPVYYGHASSVREVSLNEMLRRSRLVFEGAVTAVQAKENSRKRIHTFVTFKIQDIIKGKYHGDTITLRFLGGTVGNVTMAVSDMRLPQKGEHGIYFVESLERYQVNPLYGWSQGHFIVVPDAAGRKRIMTNRRLPVTGVLDDIPAAQTAPSKERTQALSKGVARGLVVVQDKDGLTADEFKRVLHERIAKENE
ncbi:MAG: hypothetical protein Q8P24_06540 [Desulfobacterales bacterium]|nr:hypothetical protein [Desulfobacterales bacterium]